jgi:hypothetical protein
LSGVPTVRQEITSQDTLGSRAESVPVVVNVFLDVQIRRRQPALSCKRRFIAQLALQAVQLELPALATLALRSRPAPTVQQ